MTVLHAAASAAIAPSEPLSPETAYHRAHQAALAESEIGAVGLEIESHLVDLVAVGERVAWDRVEQLLAAVRQASRRCAVTLEPGGQVELSGPPEPDIATSYQAIAP